MKQETQANETVIATCNGEHPALASPARRRGGGVRQPRNVRCEVCRSVYVGPPIDTCEACSDARDARASVTPNAVNTETETAAVRSYKAAIELTAEREGISNPFEAKRLLDGRIKDATEKLLAEQSGIAPNAPSVTNVTSVTKATNVTIATMATKATIATIATLRKPLAQSLAQPLSRPLKEITLKLIEQGKKHAKLKFDSRRAFLLARNVKALETLYGEFSIELRRVAFDAATERIPPEKRHEHLKTYLAAFKNVKNPTTEPTMYDLVVEAMNDVADMSLSDLPEIPGLPLACEADRRILAAHQRAHILYKGQPHPLSSRLLQQAARGKATRTEAVDACEMLEMFGLIKIVDRGKSGKGKGTATYRYVGQVTPQPESDDNEEMPF